MAAHDQNRTTGRSCDACVKKQREVSQNPLDTHPSGTLSHRDDAIRHLRGISVVVFDRRTAEIVDRERGPELC
jgi:hypothetical protein